MLSAAKHPLQHHCPPCAGDPRCRKLLPACV